MIDFFQLLVKVDRTHCRERVPFIEYLRIKSILDGQDFDGKSSLDEGFAIIINKMSINDMEVYKRVKA